MTPVSRKKGTGRMRILPLAALLLLLSTGLPSHAGERDMKTNTGGNGPKKDILLSLKIAEARRKDHSRRYFQSLARRMQHKGTVPRARIHVNGPR